jgi:hypothetical protein
MKNLGSSPRRQWVVKLLTGLAFLLAVSASAFVWEMWKMPGEWERETVRAKAEGRKLTLVERMPPPVPSSDNFAETPLLAGLSPGDPAKVQSLIGGWPRGSRKAGDYKQGLRTDASGWKKEQNIPGGTKFFAHDNPELQELSEAAKRPYARFPNQKERVFQQNRVIFAASKAYLLRGVIALDNGEHEAAFQDALTLFRLADTFREQPTLVALLLRGALLDSAMQLVWEGMWRRTWNESQLSEIQSAIGRVDLVQGLEAGLWTEQALFIELMQEALSRSMRSGSESGSDSSGASGLERLLDIPVIGKGLVCANLLASQRFYGKIIPEIVNVQQHRIWRQPVEEAQASLRTISPFQMCSALFRMSVPAIVSPIRTVAAQQTFLDMGNVACALERRRISSESYPADLSCLAPKYIAALPHDLLNGEPLRYRLMPEGGFDLRSSRWDKSADHREWVWPLTPANGSTLDKAPQL